MAALMRTILSDFCKISKYFSRNNFLPVASSKSFCNAIENNKNEKPQYPRLLMSGIQPTGRVHLGNYFGAIEQWCALQGRYDNMILSIVDLHSITIPCDPEILRNNITDMLATLLGCGLNAQQTIIFQQSAVLEHTQLSWILGCLTTMNKLHHLPQWKEKCESEVEVPLGLYTYPVLQAADVLIYKATDVPVGEDQLVHVELTRDIGRVFNRRYGQTFPIPKPITGEYKRMRSLRVPAAKMSKSEKDWRGRVELTYTDDQIRDSIRKAVTDCDSKLTYDPVSRSGVANLFDIHAAIRGDGATGEGLCKEYSTLDTLEYKTLLGEELIEWVRPIRNKIERYRSDPAYLIKVLNEGNERARAIAQQTYSEVARKMGLV